MNNHPYQQGAYQQGAYQQGGQYAAAPASGYLQRPGHQQQHQQPQQQAHGQYQQPSQYHNLPANAQMSPRGAPPTYANAPASPRAFPQQPTRQPPSQYANAPTDDVSSSLGAPPLPPEPAAVSPRYPSEAPPPVPSDKADDDELDDSYGLLALNKEDELSAELDARYEQVFATYDIDRDGRISESELHTALAQYFHLQYTAADMNLLVSLLDLDGSRRLPREEFKFVLGRIFRRISLFEQHSQERVTAEQFSQMLHTMGYTFTPGQVKKLFGAADRHKRGFLDRAMWFLFCACVRFCRIQFIVCDADHDGKVGAAECCMHFPRIGLPEWTEQQLTGILRALDAQDMTAIRFEEFCTLLCLVRLPLKR